MYRFLTIYFIFTILASCRPVKVVSSISESSMEVVQTSDSTLTHSVVSLVALHDSIYIERVVYQVVQDTVVVPKEVVRIVKTSGRDSVVNICDTICVRDTIIMQSTSNTSVIETKKEPIWLQWQMWIVMAFIAFLIVRFAILR